MEGKASPATAEELRDQIHEMCRMAAEMLRTTWEAFRKQDAGPLTRADHLGKEIHQREKHLTASIAGSRPIMPETLAEGQHLFFAPAHLERIGDNVENLVRCVRTLVQEGMPFSERANKEINTLFERAIELLGAVADIVLTRNRVLVRHVLEQGERYQALASEYALAHQDRLIEGVCMARHSSLYLAILDYLKDIERHARQIAEKVSAGAPG